MVGHIIASRRPTYGQTRFREDNCSDQKFLDSFAPRPNMSNISCLLRREQSSLIIRSRAQTFYITYIPIRVLETSRTNLGDKWRVLPQKG